jgi:DNA-binding MarR family transcriptional regulator
VPNATPDQLARVFDLLGPLYRQAVRTVDHTAGIPVGVRALLDLLRVRGSSTVPRIADILGLSRQFVQRCVNEAEEAGWVTLATNPVHRRSSLVVISDAGEAESLTPLATGLSEEDVAACLRVLTHLLELVRSPSDGTAATS